MSVKGFAMRELKIESLDEEWHDKDEVILHACFQLLKDFVEKEDLSITDWDAETDSAAAKNEIDFLYQWWIRKLNADAKTGIIDKEEYAEEDEMLLRLIKIRRYLWT